MFRIGLRTTVFLQLLLLQGCEPIYVSAPNQWPDDFVQKETLPPLVGKQEEDVLDTLGLPTFVVRNDQDVEHRAGGFSYVYQKLEVDTWIPMALFVPIPINNLMKYKTLASCVLMYFDSNGNLMRYTILQQSGQGGCLAISTIDQNKSVSTQVATLIGIDTEAQEQYLHYLARSENNPTRLSYLCRAADGGNPFAQGEVGRRITQGVSGVHKDIRRVYVWYSLAAKFVPSYSSPSLQGRDDQLEAIAQKMSPAQIDQAEQMLLDWKPGQCKDDLLIEIQH